MTALMVQSLLISTLVMTAAWAAEGSLRLYRVPTRWTWVAGLALALALPLVGPLFPAPLATIPGPIWSLPELASGMGARAGEAMSGERGGIGSLAGQALVALWVLTSLCLIARFGFGYMSLRLARSSWRPSRVAGTDVLISRDLGPAVTGFFKGEIVIPEWVLETDPDRGRLIVTHELEHLRAGDHRLLMSALALCVLVPWNLPLWWGLRRLRLAVELDCDRRVLRAGADVDNYTALLLNVGRRSSIQRVATATFAERATALERRINFLLSEVPRFRAARASMFVLAAAALVTLACGSRAGQGGTAAVTQAQRAAKLTGIVLDRENREPLPGAQVFFEGEGVGAVTAYNGRFFIVNAAPGSHVVVVEKEGYTTDRTTVTLEPDTTTAITIYLERQSDRPVFTPMTEPPMIKDRAAAVEAIKHHYPDSLEAMGVGGTARIWVYVAEDGRVELARTQGSSGVEALDEAAIAAAREFEFTPARNRDQVVPVWISIPITFEPPPGDDEQALRELRGALRMIATAQEARYVETGDYYPTLADTLRGFLPQGTDVVTYEGGPRGWALVLRRGTHECAMYYGQVSAPTPYARDGLAVCRE